MGIKVYFHQKFGTFYAEVEVLGKLVSKGLQITCTNFDLISVKFPPTKMLTQGLSSPLKFLFLHLISYTQSLPFLKKAQVICCRVKSTRLCFEFRRLHNDFYHRFGDVVETGLETSAVHPLQNADHVMGRILPRSLLRL